MKAIELARHILRLLEEHGHDMEVVALLDANDDEGTIKYDPEVWAEWIPFMCEKTGEPTAAIAITHRTEAPAATPRHLSLVRPDAPTDPAG